MKTFEAYTIRVNNHGLASQFKRTVQAKTLAGAMAQIRKQIGRREEIIRITQKGAEHEQVDGNREADPGPGA